MSIVETLTENAPQAVDNGLELMFRVPDGESITYILPQQTIEPLFEILKKYAYNGNSFVWLSSLGHDGVKIPAEIAVRLSEIIRDRAKSKRGFKTWGQKTLNVIKQMVHNSMQRRGQLTLNVQPAVNQVTRINGQEVSGGLNNLRTMANQNRRLLGLATLGSAAVATAGYGIYSIFDYTQNLIGGAVNTMDEEQLEELEERDVKEIDSNFPVNEPNFAPDQRPRYMGRQKNAEDRFVDTNTCPNPQVGWHRGSYPFPSNGSPSDDDGGDDDDSKPKNINNNNDDEIDINKLTPETDRNVLKSMEKDLNMGKIQGCWKYVGDWIVAINNKFWKVVYTAGSFYAVAEMKNIVYGVRDTVKNVDNTIKTIDASSGSLIPLAILGIAGIYLLKN